MPKVNCAGDNRRPPTLAEPPATTPRTTRPGVERRSRVAIIVKGPRTCTRAHPSLSCKFPSFPFPFVIFPSTAAWRVCRFSRRSAAPVSGGTAPTKSAEIRRGSPWGKQPRRRYVRESKGMVRFELTPPSFVVIPTHLQRPRTQCQIGLGSELPTKCACSAFSLPPPPPSRPLVVPASLISAKRQFRINLFSS